MEENNKTVSGSETEEQAGLPNGEPTVEQKKTLKFKIHKFLTDHANIFQIVKFTLISLIAFIAEFASMYALQYGLLDLYGNEPFDWFIFYYAPGENGAFGLAGFIAMLGSKCIAEIISFTINRKKTFNANNNVAFSDNVRNYRNFDNYLVDLAGGRFGHRVRCGYGRGSGQHDLEDVRFVAQLGHRLPDG